MTHTGTWYRWRPNLSTEDLDPSAMSQIRCLLGSHLGFGGTAHSQNWQTEMVWLLWEWRWKSFGRIQHVSTTSWVYVCYSRQSGFCLPHWVTRTRHGQSVQSRDTKKKNILKRRLLSGCGSIKGCSEWCATYTTSTLKARANGRYSQTRKEHILLNTGTTRLFASITSISGAPRKNGHITFRVSCVREQASKFDSLQQSVQPTLHVQGTLWPELS